MHYNTSGWNFKQVQGEIILATQDHGKHDSTLAQLVSAFRGGNEFQGDGFEWVLTPNGLGQFWERVGYPTRAAQMLSPALQMSIANELAGEKDNPVTVLTSNNNEVDSILSAEYAPIANSTLAFLLGGVLPRDAMVHRWNLTKNNRILDLRIVAPESWSVPLGNGRPDPGYGGLHITNDEIGGGAFSVKLTVARVACFNFVVSQHEIVHQAHRWFSPTELSDAISDGVRRVPEYAGEIATELRSWRKVPVESPELVFERIAETAGVPQYAMADARAYWREDGSEHNMFAVSQALTHGLKTLTDSPRGRLSWERRMRLEEEVWNIGQHVREHGEGCFVKCPVCHREMEEDEAS